MRWPREEDMGLSGRMAQGVDGAQLADPLSSTALPLARDTFEFIARDYSLRLISL